MDYSQAIIEKIIDNVDLEADHSKINKIMNRKLQKGYVNLDAQYIYEKFFENYEHKNLNNLKQYLTENNIDYKEFDVSETDDYKEFVMAMLNTGLRRNKTGKSQKKKSKNNNHSVSICPVLHTQNISETDTKGFTGRKDLLNKISQKLNSDKTVVLKGIGGIGKTYLSKRFAFENKDRYKRIQEVVFDNTAHSIKQLILSIKFDNLNEQERSEEDKLEQRINLLNCMDESNLLIFDNIDEFPDDIELLKELRKNSQIHIIITTRLNDGFDSYPIIEIGKLSYEEQYMLFAFHRELDITEQDKDTVNNILDFVEGHTLAIELIAKSIKTKEFTYKEILDILKKSDDTEQFPKITYNDRQDRIWHIFSNLFNTAKLPANEKKVMMYLSLLPSEGILRPILIRHLCAEYVDPVINLENSSWLIREQKGENYNTRVHSIIREVVIHETSPTADNCKSFIENVCELLSNPNSSYIEDLCKLSKSIVDLICFDDCPSEENLRYLCAMAEFCNKNYKYYYALDIYKCALSVYKNCDKQNILHNNQYVFELYINIGKLYQRLAKYQEAIKYFDEVTRLCDQNSLNQAQAFRKLGEVYRKKSEYEDALKNDITALNIFKKFDDIIKIAEAQNAIGVVYLNMADAEKDKIKKNEFYDSAENYYEEALKNREKCKETPAGELAFSYHNIGTLYYRKQMYDKARENHEKALKIRKNKDNDIPQTDIAASFVWLGKDYLELGKNDEALDYFNKSIEIREKILGKNHPDYAWSLDSLSYYYEKEQKISKAKEIMLEVIKIRKEVLGCEHKYTQQAISRYENL